MSGNSKEEPKHPIQIKAKGKQLVSTSRDILKNIPPEFISDATLVVKKQPVPTETQITSPFPSGQVGSRVEMDNTTQSQKIDEFLGVEFPITLTEEVVTPDGQIGQITRILSDQPQDLEPHDPTQIDGKIDNLGGGLFVKSETVVDEVFPNKLFAKERPEVIPPAFRAQVPTETTRIDGAGTAAMPALQPGDVLRSSEETKVGVKRDTVSARPPDVLPVTLEDSVITPDNQLGTRIRILDDNAQTVTPDPKLVQGEVEAIGGGLTVKTEVTVPEVFPAHRYEAEKPDPVPQAFRAVVPTETTRIDVEGTASMPALGASDIAKSSEEVKVGVKRDTITTRSPTALPATLGDRVLTPENQLGTRIRTLDDADQTLTPDPKKIQGEVEALGGGLFLKTEVTVPQVFPGRRYEIEKPDPVPQAFRAVVPTETTKVDTEGTATMPTLGAGDIAKSSEEVKVGVKRDTVTTRPATALPTSLSDRVITPENQLGTRIRTLDDNDLPLSPDPKIVQGEVEALGGGLFQKTEVTVSEVFPGRRYEIEKPDPVPQAFRAVVPTETTKVDVEGTAAMPTLGASDIAKSSEEIKVGVKRDTVTTRPPTALPATISDRVLTPENQLGTRTRTLDDADQALTPDPKIVQGEVEGLGGGLFLKTEVEVDEVFPSRRFEIEKPDPVPQAFRAVVPTQTTRVDAEGTAAMPTLGASDIAKSSEEVKVGVKRDTTSTRPPTALPAALTDTVITPENQLGTRVRTLDDTTMAVTPDPKKIQAEVEALGGGLFLKTEVTVPEVFENKRFALEKPDPVPQAFRAVVPTETSSIDVEGTAAMPTLGPSDISKSSEEVKEGVKRDTVTTRPATSLPATLTDEVLTPENQLGTRIRTLDDATMSVTPDPKKVQGEVEALGGGLFLKTEVTVSEVFERKRFSIEKPDPVPQAFRAVVPTETSSIDVEGTAAMPTLGASDIAKSSEEVKDGVKRDTVSTRPPTSLPATLTDSVVTPENQLGTRVRTLDDAPQTVTPSPTLAEGSVEALGGGLTLKTEITVPEVFARNQFSIERPEVIPLAFRSAVPATTTRMDEAGTAALPTLSGSEIERISEQVKEGVRRQTVRTRGALGTFPTLTMRTFDNDLHSEILITMDIVAMGSAFSPPAGTIDYDESEIDDVYSLRKVFKLVGGTPPASFDTREPGTFYFPALLTGITVAAVALANTAEGDPRNEVNWQPVWRPGFTMDVNFIITTSFHLTEPSPDAQYVIRTNDIVFKGVSFQVNLPKVLNNSLSGIGVAFSADALYGNLSENFSVSASVPSASSYTSAIGTTQILASKVAPWRMLWVKRNTKLLLL